MTLTDEIIKPIEEEFPDAELEVHERRDTVLEIRVTLEKECEEPAVPFVIQQIRKAIESRRKRGEK